MTTSSYGVTSGSDEREARPLMEGLMAFSLRDEVDALRSEAAWLEGDRTARTLAKEVDFRVVLSVLRPGAALNEQDGVARASIHMLEGGAHLNVAGESAELGPGQLAVVDAGRPWILEAATECAILLVLAWPREHAGV